MECAGGRAVRRGSGLYADFDRLARWTYVFFLSDWLFAAVVLEVGGYRGERPFDPLFEGVFADVAVLLCANPAGEVETGIGVDKEFHGLAEPAFDQRGKSIDLHVRFEDVEVPGHGQMTVDVEALPVFDHPQIVQVDPVLAAMLVEIRDQVL